MQKKEEVEYMAKFAGTLVLFLGFTAGCCDLHFGTGCCGYFRKGPASHPSAFLSPTSVETCGYIIARESMLIATRLPLPFMRLYTCGISSFCNPPEAGKNVMDSSQIAHRPSCCKKEPLTEYCVQP